MDKKILYLSNPNSMLTVYVFTLFPLSFIGISIYIIFMLFYDCQQFAGNLLGGLVPIGIPSLFWVYLVKNYRTVVIKDRAIHMTDVLYRKEIIEGHDFHSIVSYLFFYKLQCKSGKKYCFFLDNWNCKLVLSILANTIQDGEKELTRMVREYLQE